MKKILTVLIASLFILSVTAVAFAADKQVTGAVTAVDAKAMTLTVKGKAADVSLTATDKTSVMMGKEKKTLADVKVGDKVMVRYMEAEGKMTAKSITIKAAPAAPAAKPAEKAPAAPSPAPAPEKKPAAGGY